MFEKLEIQNFQSHRKMLLKFDPGVNIIVGQSDSGKTAIFRALKWLLTNRPSGDSFVSWFSKTGSEVRLKTDNNLIIHRKGFYSIDEKDFAAIGTGVPEQIEQALKMSELNWQGQMDAPFLLSESSGEVSRRLNEVADLSVIDTALSNINRIGKECSREIKNLEFEKEEGFLSLEKYEGLAEAESNLCKLKKADKLRQKKENVLDIGQKVLHDLDRTERIMESFPNIAKVEKLLKAFEADSTELKKKQAALEEACATLYDLDKTEKTIVSIPDTTKAESLLKKLSSCLPELKDKEKELRRMKLVWTSYQEQTTDLQKIEMELAKREKEFMKEFPNICPLCGRGEDEKI